MRKAEVCLSPMFGAWRFHAIVLLLLILGSLQVSQTSAASISVDADCTLAQAIASANEDRAIDSCAAGDGADTIKLAGDIALSAELPAITSPITIMGGGFTISGDQRFRIFFVAEDGELSIESLTLRDGQTTEGARACDLWDDGDYGAGGAICNLGALSITESEFSGHKAEFGGGIASVGTVTVDGSDFNDNRASSGGAIFNWGEGSLTVTGSNFSANKANTTFALLERDSAEEDESAEDSNMRIALDPVFYDGYGGAIAGSLSGVITISETSFRDNVAQLGGGAMLDHGTTEINDSQFTNNSSAFGAGGAIESRLGTVTVTDSVLSGNSAHLGGAVNCWGVFAAVDSEFKDNNAVRGGAIHTSGGTFSATGSSFIDNSASDSGGAIFTFNWAGGMLSAANSVFRGNSAEIRGGAIFGSGTIRISGSQFRLNQAGDLGGGIINSGALTLVDSEFYGNSATEGGGIYNERDRAGVLQQDGNSYSGNFGGDCVGCE